ncbi:MAG TPA: DUF488 domain-containing protein, partial [Nitrososphaera sp.]|nr:DUF488 domain-containing protein [Nitrososphaera sp.]
MQKLLFLFTRRQAKATYDFIPYRFGCYSYSANADMTTMVAKGVMSEDETHFARKDDTDYLSQLKPDDRRDLLEVKKTYGSMSAQTLMRYTYLHYPFYAIKSEVARKILSKTEIENVLASTTKSTKTILFTIGYEGISLEEYLMRLLTRDVKVLVDVRNNPLSMKYGFSKSKLKTYCENLGILYVHFPDVGIQSAQRQELNVQSDYDRLFDTYRTHNLTQTTDSQLKILSLLKQHKRIALTCFEANVCQCHRK